MASPPNIKNQRGFTLIEALFSAIVLGIGLLALAGFHAVALQDGTLVKMRMVATSLAQEKLDDLRSFSLLKDDPDTAANECAAGTFCYTEIAANAGGQEDGSGNLLLPAGTVKVTVNGTTYDHVSGTQYTRAWTVACYSETAGGAPVVDAACTDADFKLVTVTIRWTDNKGVDQTTSLQGAVYGLDPSDVARAAANPASSPGPKVKYTPQPGSVPIEIGGGKSTETSKPLPKVSGGDSKRVLLTSVVYTGASGDETLVSQEEDVAVNCTCTLKNPAKGLTPHRTVWNGAKLDREYGVEVTKMVGVPNDLSPSGTTKQDELCIQCCNDHHDTNADADTAASGTQLYPAYRPYIALDKFDSVTGDHKHYKADGSIAGVGEDYVEACRLRRIDGYWRVVPDFLLADVAAMGCDYFVDSATTECPPSAAENSTKLNTYRDWVRDVLQSFVSYLNANKTIDTSSSSLPAFTSGVAPLLDTSNSAHDIEVINGGSKQLLARGIYVDVIFKPQSSGTPRAVDADYVNAVYSIYSSNDFEKLQYLPFSDQNLTLLANWSPTSTNTSGPGNPKYGDCSPADASINYGSVTPDPSRAVCVTNEAISTINDAATNYYDDYYSRGKIIGKLSSGSTLIKASIARGNSGLAVSPSIDGGTDTPLTAQVRARIPSGSTASGITGRFIRGNSGANLSLVDWRPDPAASCAFNSPSAVTSDSSSAEYTCTVTNPWTGKLDFGDKDATAVYSFKLTDGTPYTATTITAPATMPDVVVYGETASLYGQLFCNGQACSGVSITTSTGQTCTISGNVVACAVPLSSGTWSGTVTIANMSGNNKLGTPATQANDCISQTTGAKTTGPITAGPGDNGSASNPTAFSFCAK